MSSVKTLTSGGVINGPYSVLYGISITSLLPSPAPSAALVVEVHDAAVADGSGPLIARLYINPTHPSGQGAMDGLSFVDGVSCPNGIAVNVTTSGHTDITISIEFD